MQDTRIAGIAGDLCYQYVVAGQIQLGTSIVLTSIFVHKWTSSPAHLISTLEIAHLYVLQNCIYIQMIEVHNCMMILLYNSLANA